MKRNRILLFTLATLMIATSALTSCERTNADKVDVTFDLNYEGSPMSKVVPVEKGKRVPKPETPVHTVDPSITFKYWSTSKLGEEFIFITPINDDIVLYAQWSNMSTRDEKFDELHAELKADHEFRRDYNSNGWKWLALLDRDWELSPQQPGEVIATSGASWKESGIWVRPLYTNSPIYISTGINNGGQYKYKDPASGEEKTGNFGGGRQFDREHVFPKSYGFEESTSRNDKVYSDLHNLHMAEGPQGNQYGHNNYFYANVANKTASTEVKDPFTNTQNGWRGPSTNGYIFEPADADKGDIARTIFYMATRYRKYDAAAREPALRLTSDIAKNRKTTSLTSTATGPAEYGLLSDLLEWHKNDPVDNFEIRRNELAKIIQGNRNPFVEEPELAEFLFA